MHQNVNNKYKKRYVRSDEPPKCARAAVGRDVQANDEGEQNVDKKNDCSLAQIFLGVFQKVAPQKSVFLARVVTEHEREPRSRCAGTQKRRYQKSESDGKDDVHSRL